MQPFALTLSMTSPKKNEKLFVLKTKTQKSQYVEKCLSVRIETSRRQEVSSVFFLLSFNVLIYFILIKRKKNKEKKILVENYLKEKKS